MPSHAGHLISVVQVFQVQIPRVQDNSVIGQVSMVALALREANMPARYDIQMDITLNDAPLIHGPFVVDFQDRLRARAIGQINGLVIPGPGTLRFRLVQNDETLAEGKTTVSMIGEPEMIQSPTAPSGPPAT